MIQKDKNNIDAAAGGASVNKTSKVKTLISTMAENNQQFIMQDHITQLAILSKEVSELRVELVNLKEPNTELKRVNACTFNLNFEFTKDTEKIKQILVKHVLL